MLDLNTLERNGDVMLVGNLPGMSGLLRVGARYV